MLAQDHEHRLDSSTAEEEGDMKRLLLLVCLVSCGEPTSISSVRCDAPCYTGPEYTLGVGVCRPGTPVCEGDEFIACEGQVTPSLELCDTLDNDCDGIVDDDYTGDDLNIPCGSRVGQCSKGETACVGGAIVCAGSKDPVEEKCDHLDWDCDGDPYNVPPAGFCFSGPPDRAIVPPCHPGLEVCRSGHWICENERPPGREVCTRPGDTPVDEDCNGLIDDNLPVDPGATFDVVFVVDLSGSMSGSLDTAKEIIIEMLSDLTRLGDTRFRFGLIVMPGEVDGEYTQVTNLLEPWEMKSQIHILTIGSGGEEPSLDILFDISEGETRFNWRRGSIRAVMMLTDEPAQSFRDPALTSVDVINSLVPSGYVFNAYTTPAAWYSFDPIVQATGGHIGSLDVGTDLLDGFTSVESLACVP